MPQSATVTEPVIALDKSDSKNKAILANIIYKNFNIENNEISYIFKSLSKKNILERIKDYL